GQLAGQFDSHGRSLAEVVALIDRSNRRTEATIGERRESLEAMGTALDAKSSELEQRVTRFSGHLDRSLESATRSFDSKSETLDQRVGRFGSVLDETLGNVAKSLDGKAEDLNNRLTRFSELLDQSLESATDRTRDIARLIADSTNQGARAIAENLESIRAANEGEYKRTGEAMRAIYDQTTQDAEGMLSQAAGRFAEVVDGLKRMAAEMQRELDATRNELRKGILELPQETADTAAQMRRVIVDQIEALA